jgi:hypothetical protein
MPNSASPSSPTSLRSAPASWLAGLGLVFALLAGGCAGPSTTGDRPRPVSPATRVADATLDRWITALGGEAAIRELRNIDSRGHLTFSNGQPAVALHVRATNQRRFRIETELPNGTYVQASDAAVAWQQHSTLGFGFLPQADLQARLMVTDLQGPLLVKARYETRVAVPDEVVDGRTLHVLMMRRPGQLVEKWYFDPATNLRVRLEYPQWFGGRVTEFGDFRAIQGTRMIESFRIVDVIGGQRSELQLEELAGNVNLAPELFTAPPEATAAALEIDHLFSLHAAYAGGRASSKVQTRVTEEESLLTTTGLRTEGTTYIKRPNRILVEESSPGLGKTWQGFDGKTGWAWSEVEGYREIKGAELQQLVGRTVIDNSQALGTIAPLRQLLPSRGEGDRTITGVRFAIPAAEVGEIYFDQKTGEMVRTVSVVQAGPTGQMKVTADLSDYREVDGVRLPFRSVLTSAAIRTEVTVKSVMQNIPIDDAIFRPRRE